MKKILLSLFILSSLSYTAENPISTEIPVNIQAIVSAEIPSLIITNIDGIPKNSLDYTHILTTTSASDVVESFAVHIKSGQNTYPIADHLTFDLANDGVILVHDTDKSKEISTTFSNILKSTDSKYFTLTNSIEKATVERIEGLYNNSTTLTVTYNKTSSRP
ncbi:hypothetical protein [Cetobacterium sp. SF1]|uniref:hypothetical protein n=1 Tax=Cetobacterium sp. SF1 TaxID=3417654 RepID=UPI003CEFCA47